LFVTEKSDKREEKNAKCFPVGCSKLMLRFTEKGKFGWASCCKTWLREKKMEGEFAIAERERIEKEMFGLWVTPLVGRHVVNDSKIGCNVGCHVVNEP